MKRDSILALDSCLQLVMQTVIISFADWCVRQTAGGARDSMCVRQTAGGARDSMCVKQTAGGARDSMWEGYVLFRKLLLSFSLRSLGA